jgi:hypothetical protein
MVTYSDIQKVDDQSVNSGGAKNWSKMTELDLQMFAYTSKEMNLESNNEYSIPFLDYENEVNISLEEAKEDILGFPQKLISNLSSNGIGELVPTLSNNYSLAININDTSLSNDLTIELDYELSDDEVLDVRLDHLIWEYDENDFAYATIKFMFDTLSITLVYASTSSFNQYMSNITGSIKFINDLTDNFHYPLSFLANLNNVSSPNILRTIEWSVYLPRQYNFYACFDKISLFTTSEEIDLIINNQKFSSKNIISFKLLPNQSQILKITDFTKAIINLTRSFLVLKPLWGDLSLTNNRLFFNGSLSIVNLPDYTYNLEFPQGFHLININVPSDFNIIKKSDYTIILSKDESSLVHIFAELNQIQVEHFQIQDPVQGKLFSFNISTKSIIKGAIVQNHYSKADIVTIMNHSISTIIPAIWNKGSFQAIVWFKDGFSTFINYNLLLSPSKNIITEPIILHPGIKRVFPIFFQNLTSGELIRATKVKTYVNSNLRSIDDSHGIVFEPGEFPPGNYSLFVNATKFGVVPLEFNLIIIVKKFHPIIEFNVSRESETSVILGLSLPEIVNWTISTYYRIEGAGLNISGEIFQEHKQLYLTNEEWAGDEELSVMFYLFLGMNIASHVVKISIPSWIESSLSQSSIQNRSSSNSAPSNHFSRLTALGIVSIISSVGVFFWKHLKSGNKPERISF